MKRLAAPGLVLACGLCLTQPAWAELQPGAYTMTVSVTLQNMKQPRTQTIEDCLTPEEAKNPAEGLLRSLIDRAKCTISNKTVSSSRLSADFSCLVGTNTNAGHVEMTFADKTISGQTKTEIMSGDRLVNTMTTDIRAVRTGECKQQDTSSPSPGVGQ